MTINAHAQQARKAISDARDLHEVLSLTEFALVAHGRGWCHNGAICDLCVAQNTGWAAEQARDRLTTENADLVAAVEHLEHQLHLANLALEASDAVTNSIISG